MAKTIENTSGRPVIDGDFSTWSTMAGNPPSKNFGRAQALYLTPLHCQIRQPFIYRRGCACWAASTQKEVSLWGVANVAQQGAPGVTTLLDEQLLSWLAHCCCCCFLSSRYLVWFWQWQNINLCVIRTIKAWLLHVIVVLHHLFFLYVYVSLCRSLIYLTVEWLPVHPESKWSPGLKTFVYEST